MDLFSAKVAYASAVDSFISSADNLIINPLIGLLFAVAVAYFLWGMLEFILSQTNQEKKTTGKTHMIWGVIGIVIMMGVWGILNIIISTFGIKDIHPENPPGPNQVTLPNYP